MMNRKELTKEQVLAAVKNGEFTEDVTASTNKVIVIMTQDWCPQWRHMQEWIYGIQMDEPIDVYELVYNKTDYRQEFMNFKETQWKNDLIPYVRYYKNGKLIKTSNYMKQSEVENILKTS
ncbi:MAG: hypothetical protein N2484_12340 [Clostridia bacterium]|nr:hypothetical protein [Clostridia bacterium]